MFGIKHNPSDERVENPRCRLFARSSVARDRIAAARIFRDLHQRAKVGTEFVDVFVVVECRMFAKIDCTK